MTADARDPWMGANLFDPEIRDDPYAALARLREIDPVNETASCTTSRPGCGR